MGVPGIVLGASFCTIPLVLTVLWGDGAANSDPQFFALVDPKQMLCWSGSSVMSPLSIRWFWCLLVYMTGSRIA